MDETSRFLDGVERIPDDIVTETRWIGRRQKQEPFRASWLDSDSQNPKQRKDSRKVGKMLLWTLICALAVWGLIDITRTAYSNLHPLIQDPNSNPCWCGTSDEEAIAMGCQYDHIAVDWLPPSCIDHDLVQEFDKSGPEADGSWSYFDRPGTGQARVNASEIDDFAKAGRGYFATADWHVSHCLFTWRKQFRAAYREQDLEPWNNHEEHVKHCGDYIRRVVRWGLEADVVDTRILGQHRHVHGHGAGSTESQGAGSFTSAVSGLRFKRTTNTERWEYQS